MKNIQKRRRHFRYVQNNNNTQVDVDVHHDSVPFELSSSNYIYLIDNCTIFWVLIKTYNVVSHALWHPLEGATLKLGTGCKLLSLKVICHNPMKILPLFRGFNKHRRPTKHVGYFSHRGRLLFTERRSNLICFPKGPLVLRYASVMWTLYFSHFFKSFLQVYAEFVYVQKLL